jgi:hypothetical protein
MYFLMLIAFLIIDPAYSDPHQTAPNQQGQTQRPAGLHVNVYTAGHIGHPDTLYGPKRDQGVILIDPETGKAGNVQFLNDKAKKVGSQLPIRTMTVDGHGAGEYGNKIGQPIIATSAPDGHSNRTFPKIISQKMSKIDKIA